MIETHNQMQTKNTTKGIRISQIAIAQSEIFLVTIPQFTRCVESLNSSLGVWNWNLQLQNLCLPGIDSELQGQ
jgi:hypothetical protein